MSNLRILFAIILCGASLTAQDELRIAAEHYAAGRYDKAALEYDKVLVRDARNFEAVLGLARSMLAQHETSRSQGLFERAIRLKPKSAEARFGLGQVMERRGLDELEKNGMMARPTLADSAKAYREAVALDPERADIRLAEVRVLFLLERYDEALEAVDALLEKQPDDRSGITYRLGLLYRGGRYREFLELCEAQRGAMPIDESRVLDALARLERRASVKKQFLKMLDEGWAGRSEPYQILAAAWSQGKLLEARIELLQTVVEQRPEEYLARYWLGDALARRARYAEAVQAFRGYLEIDPDNLRVTGNLAQIARLQGQLDHSTELCLKLVEIDPSSEVTRIELSGTVAALVGEKRFEDALALHTRLHETDLLDTDLTRNQAVLLKEVGRLEDSEKLLGELVEEAPLESSRLAAYMNDQALCLKGLGRLEEAIAVLQKAADLWPEQADARENLGVIHFERGQNELARGFFEAAIEARREAGIVDSKSSWRSRYYLRALARRR